MPKGRPASWDDHFQQLQHFHKIHRHFRLPSCDKADRRLYQWFWRQTKLLNDGSLTVEQAEKFRSIGITGPQQNHNPSSWETMLERLKNYRKEHGHCLVPQKCKDDPALGAWVDKQRQARKHSRLSHDRFEKLERIGFCWDASEWREGKSSLDHETVKESLHVGEATETDGMSTSNEDVPNHNVGLDVISACAAASDQCNQGGEEDEGSWDSMFNKLIEYQCMHGHLHVSILDNPDPNLISWVEKQRTLHSLNKMPSKRRAKLEEIGFFSEPSTTPHTWDWYFERLKVFAELCATTYVPSCYEVALYRWTLAQRKAFRHGDLEPDQIAKLESIGFDWDFASEKYTMTELLTEADRVRALIEALNGSKNLIDATKQSITAPAETAKKSKTPPATRTIPAKRAKLINAAPPHDANLDTKEDEIFEACPLCCWLVGQVVSNRRKYSVRFEDGSTEAFQHDDPSMDDIAVAVDQEHYKEDNLYVVGTPVKQFRASAQCRCKHEASPSATNAWRNVQASGDTPNNDAVDGESSSDGAPEEALSCDIAESRHDVQAVGVTDPIHVGAPVKKRVKGDQWLYGRIVSSYLLYHVRYEDGDEEEFKDGEPELDNVVVVPRASSSIAYEVGTGVEKLFPDHGWFQGEIDSIERIYVVRYTDRTEEDFVEGDPALLEMVGN